jgi:hypothetical protein
MTVIKRNLLLDLLSAKYPKTSPYLDIFDYLQFDLNTRIYSYGEHIGSPHEGKKTKYQSSVAALKQTLYNLYLKVNKENSLQADFNIMSSAYFSLENIFTDSGINVISPPWMFGKRNVIYDKELFDATNGIKAILATGDFKTLLSEKFHQSVLTFRSLFKEYILANNVKALFIPQDITFFEKLSIDLLRELGLPTFNFIHGLPGLYNSTDYNRTDYLVVWGNAIKHNFVKGGIPESKIIVNGHPKYSGIQHSPTLRFELENVLILTKSTLGSQFSEDIIRSDRGNLIYYLESIKSVLVSLGVSKATVRLHPSANALWYKKFVDTSFFKFDQSDLMETLGRTTLVIGCTSTVFLESLMAGVNYVVYEPEIEKGLLVDYLKSVPPFDGSDSNVPVAKNIDTLRTLLKEKVKVNTKVLTDYIAQSYDTGMIMDIIKIHSDKRD